MRAAGPTTLLEALEQRLQGPAPSRTALALLLVLLCCFLFFYRLYSRDLWSPDEPRYAQVAREMLARSDWVVPHLNGEIYTQKPMMFFWLTGLGGKLLGDVTPLAVRLPSALAATVIVLVLFLWGTRYWGAGRSWIAAAVLATSVQFLWVGRCGQMDLVFAAFVFLALVGGFETLKGRAAAGYRVLFYAGMAGATLTKGPLGLLLCWLGPLVYSAARREWRPLRFFKPLWGMLAVAAVVLSWYVPAVVSTQGAYGGWDILWKQTYRRAVQGYSHPNWIGYFLYDFPAIFLPWSLWLPAAWHLLRKESGKMSNALLGRTDADRYLAGFFYAGFVLFSLSTEKRGNYLLPLFPAAAVYVSSAWPDWRPALLSGRLAAFYRLLFGFLSLILILAAPAILLSLLFAPEAYRPPWKPLPPFALAFLLLGFCYAIICRRRLWRTGWIGLMALLCLLVAFQSHVVEPVVNPHKSARYMCEPLAAERARGAEIISYIQIPAQFIYYSKGPIRLFDTPEEIVEYMKGNPKVLCLMEAPSYRKFKTQLEEVSWVVEERRVGHRKMVLLSNYLRPEEPTSEAEEPDGLWL